MMKFKIKKEVDNVGTWYWTIPSNIFLRVWWFLHLSPSSQSAYGVWLTKERALQHIKRWNNGYYKKRYYSKYV